jgi:transcription antitermination protein NusB
MTPPDDATGPGPDTPPPTVRPVAGGRTAARERAVHLLYEEAMKGQDAGEVLAGQVLAADPYAADLVRGVDEHHGEIDELLTSLAPDSWPLERMATLDLAVMRLAVFELAHHPDVPTGVILAEAVELAEQYGTDESPRFVNGLLAAAAARLRG